MKKVFFCILLTSILISCAKEEGNDWGNQKILNYNGSNPVGKFLISKIIERDQGIEELNLTLSHPARELLFDHAIFGQGFGFGIHYAIPVRNTNTNIVEGCIIYQINEEIHDNFNLKAKIKAPLFIDSEKYNTLPIQQKSCLVFFKRWKEQGLEITEKLCIAEKCFSRTNTEIENETSFYSTSNEYYHIEIEYWIDLGGYLPNDAHAYAIGLEKRSKIFKGNYQALTTSNTAGPPEICVNMERINTILTFYNGINGSLETLLTNYMNQCANDFRNCPGAPRLEYHIITPIGNQGGSSSGSGGGSNSGSTPGSGNGSWNPQTHHGILEAIQSQCRLNDTDLKILIDANDYCDNLLEGNQFSSKAYYHAMKTSEKISEQAARDRFKQHLTENFIMFLTKKETNHIDAIYALGIAIHGIVDSFCPGHKGFQYYSLANFSEHAKQDKGALSPEQVGNSIKVTVTIYRELNRPEADDQTIDNVIAMWEEAYNKNLEENN